MNDVTNDWSKFGYIELEEAKNLLSHIKEIDSFGKVEVFFNMNSGYVFLTDEDYRVWMMSDENTIEEWFNCPYCGHEGFKCDMEHEFENKDCEDYLISIGVIEVKENELE